MAKEKKKGFFSWLGFGRKDEKQQPEEELQPEQQGAEEQQAAEEQAERQRLAAEAEAAQKRADEQAAAHKLAEQQLAEQQAAEQKAAAEKAAAEQAERQRLAAEAEAAQKRADEQAAAQKLAEQQLAEQQAAEQKAASEKIAAEQAERQRLAAEAEAAQKRADEQAAAQQKAAAEKAVAEQAERQRLAAEAEAAQKRADEQAAAQKLAEQQAAEQKAAAEKAAAEQAERQRLAAEAEAAQKRADEQAAAQQLAEQQAAEQKAAAEKAAAEEAERQRLAAEAEAAQKRADEQSAAQKLAEQQLAEQQAAEQKAAAEEEQQRLALAQAEDESKTNNTEQEKPKKEGFFARLKKGLLKTRQNLGSGFFSLFKGKKIDDDLFEELEEQLLIADVGVDTTRKIINSLVAHASRKELKDAEALYSKLREEMSDILSTVDKPLVIEGKKPYVILMVGVNGVGKTTTIGKLARQYQSEGKSVMLAAGDTFRAAAVEQLQVWGERNNIPVVAQHTGADPASVIFDAIQSAQAKGIDILIADTAGRLQNKAHLMEELKKIVRVMRKLDVEAPHEIMLTLDASTGQNAVNQAKLFDEAVGLTGITLTKLDGTAKGGVIFAIADQMSIPIRYIGVGEGIEDLRPFKSEDFIEALFARED
ncbi:signal recognition particle-docking protein FtsY [Moellerella wisconsensis]|uniref:signal recognition particle-docking protein FtsY n=1 Tax=Moellerella wisconsensis TaxID=158849 RepID=UPI001F4D97D3|nr:signal recognition particle-docking protein FtsY [Moellerella wisconsensis]UNH24551.1 signal recognition particle-docking protein FtsY [Moellerella wisconsensis]